MNDPDQPHRSEDESPPEGMEVRKRQVRRRKKKANKSEAKSLLKQGKDLLEKMQMSQDDDSSGHVGVAEQVRRLQKDEEEDKPLDEVWGTKKRSTSWLWVSLCGIILPLLVVGFALKFFNEAKTPDIVEDDLEVTVTTRETNIDGPSAWFDTDSMTYLTKARQILNLLNQAETPEEIRAYIRPSTNPEKNPIQAQYWPSPFLANNINTITWQMVNIPVSQNANDNPDRGILKINGRRQDQSKFSAYFVKEGHEFLLDWDATTSWSEMSIKDLRKARPTEPTEIRCVIAKKAIFDRRFRNIDHSGFILAEPETGDFIFAYVPLADEAREEIDKQLKDVLQYGRFVMALKRDEPVVIKVKAVNNDRFEIVSFKHQGWVNPI